MIADLESNWSYENYTKLTTGVEPKQIFLCLNFSEFISISILPLFKTQVFAKLINRNRTETNLIF